MHKDHADLMKEYVWHLEHSFLNTGFFGILALIEVYFAAMSTIMQPSLTTFAIFSFIFLFNSIIENFEKFNIYTLSFKVL